MLRCLIVDDEPLALDVLEDYLHKVPFLHLVRRCRNGFEALEALQKEEVDLLFLDIQMPNITGLQLMRSLKKNVMVIFTTAYDQYALEGFNLDAVDYLLKPIPFERFLRAANKAYELHELRRKTPAAPVPTAEPPAESEAQYLFVKADYRVVKINLNDLRYIEGLKDYVKIYAGEKPILTLQSLKSLEEKLPPGQFIRVHRSYIVAINKIESLQRNRIFLGNKVIPIGETYVETFNRIVGAL